MFTLASYMFHLACSHLQAVHYKIIIHVAIFVLIFGACGLNHDIKRTVLCDLKLICGIKIVKIARNSFWFSNDACCKVKYVCRKKVKGKGRL